MLTNFSPSGGFSPSGEGRYADSMTLIRATRETWAGFCNREDIAYGQSSQQIDTWLSKQGAGSDGLASFSIGRRA